MNLRRWFPPDALAEVIARAPVSVRSKLLLAFVTIAALLVVVGVVAVAELGRANRRSEELIELQRKIAVFRQVQHDTLAHLSSVFSALLTPEPTRLAATLRQLDQFGYDLDRLRHVAEDEAELYGRVRREYDEFVAVVQEMIERVGRQPPGEAMRGDRLSELADNLERLTNELVNKAEATMVSKTDEGAADYHRSRRLLVLVAVVAFALALGLGYGLSMALMRPVRAMDRRFAEIAAGDFGRRIDVANRDELGALAADLNRMSDELGRLYRELETVSRHKSEFLANMSHELRTPLNAVIGFSEALMEQMFGEMNDKQLEYLSDIHSSGQHLLTLINDILDLSKIEAGRMDLELGCFDLTELLQQSLALVRERAQQQQLRLELKMPGALGEWVADRLKVKQVVLNLLSNAVKFTPPGGRVTLSAHRADDGQSMEVIVSDTGVGIAPEEHELVFEEFRQARGSTLRKAEGTGLGLPLARRLVELHGGSIRLDSQPGAGCTFSFTLPQRDVTAL
jgi:signal transduction histidine kinase